jgi:sigma-B regulation protein RsbU (phosphoserine phosphatase)
MNILVADDHPTNRKLLCETLRAEGYAPVPAVDGAEALAIMSGPEAPLLAVIDWEMPRLDGVELCQEIRKLVHFPVHPRLILLTVRDAREDVVTGLRSGADDYVTKPYHAAELLARVRIGAQLVELQLEVVVQVRELEAALAEVTRLKEFLPLCHHCKKVRDDENYWHQLAAYIGSCTDTVFTHGVCPECAMKEMHSYITELETRVGSHPASPLAE